MTRYGWLVVLGMILCVGTRAEDKPLEVFAFGSCNRQAFSHRIWNGIMSVDPELWIWGGDNIYADYHKPAARKKVYDRLKRNRWYSKLRGNVPIIGTWDDHDYGDNNVGASYRYKKESQKLLLDFLDEPVGSSRWDQEGVYASYLYGPPGKRVQVILLDLRYFREKPGFTSRLLGEAQWLWLESQLLEQEAEVRVIVSSSQFLPDGHSEDRWDQYPTERSRMLYLLAKVKGRLLMLSGDMHFAEFSKTTLLNGAPLYEFTASGMTHSTGPAGRTRNRFRIGKFHGRRNFGVVRFDWDKNPVGIDMEIHLPNGKLAQSIEASAGER